MTAMIAFNSVKRTIAFLIIALSAASCLQEEHFPERSNPEGIDVRTEINFGVKHRPIITRAAQDSRYEYRVNNVYVLIFDSSGSLHYHGFYTDGKGMSVNNGEATCTGSLTIDTKTANEATVVGIANIYQEDVTSTAYMVTKEDLDGISTLDELKDFVMYMDRQSPSISRGALFMMTGYAKNKEGSTKIDITQDAVQDFTLEFERTDAKVEFAVTSENPRPDEWHDFSFKAKEWQVLRVPKQTLLIPDDNGLDAGGEGMEYFDTPILAFETENVTPDGADNGGNFIFYMPENMKQPKSRIPATGTSAEQYALREEKNTEPYEDGTKPGQSFRNTDWKYADENSTYVVFTGTLSYRDAIGYPVNADIRCTIHLGYGEKGPDGEPLNDANDFRTRRNTHYRYNVKIRGVDDIIIEVRSSGDGTETEVRPGYEGNVTYMEDQLFELDCHYDRIRFRIPKEAITDELNWAVSTPYSNGTHIVGTGPEDEEAFRNIRDYKWIKFAINADYGYTGTIRERLVKYPGDLNYNNPDWEKFNDNLGQQEKDANDQPSPSYPNHPDARLLDVHQLIDRLKEEKAKENSTVFEDDGHVYITAFVDEYLYFRNPNTGKFDESDGQHQHRSLWKECVEKEDRLLHIIASNTRYSPDGNSSVTFSRYSFKQNSIRTVFNVNKPDLKTAWGLESRMETGALTRIPAPGDSFGANDMSDGRKNTIAFLRGKQWSDVLNTEANYQMNPDYEAVYYGCLTKNRDLDGDNQIDDREVRWYLASINQLTDIFLGEYALERKAWLYPPGTTEQMHYASSSMIGDRNPWMLWAEEGASRGNSDVHGEDYRYNYRCVRGLGLPLDDWDEQVEDLVSYTENADGTYTFDLSNMNTKSRRQNYETVPLPLHDERSANNLIYGKFEVAQPDFTEMIKVTHGGVPTNWFGNSSTEDDVRIVSETRQWADFQTIDLCPKGYRIPNQRELLVITSRLPLDSWPSSVPVEVTWYEGNSRNHEQMSGIRQHSISGMYYMSQTAFSMDGKYGYTNERDGFMWTTQNNGRFFLRNGSHESGWVRCIKDVQ